MLKKILLPLLVTFFGLFISLIVVEIGIRLMPNKQVSWSDRPKYYYKQSPSETLIDYKYEKKSPNTFRIGVIGDSYTFAPYMQFTDAFPKVLERMLNLNYPLNSNSVSNANTTIKDKVEVINYGVPGYSTSHEIQSVNNAINKDEVDLLLLEITLNDPEIKPYRPEGIKVFDHFGKLQAKGVLATLFKYWKTLAFVVTRIHNQKTVDDYKSYFNDLFNNPKTYNSYTKSINEIIKISKEKNVPLIAVVFPLFGLPLDAKYPFHEIHEKARNPLNSANIPNIDLYDLYAGIPLERMQVIPGEDRHPNEIAHRMAAERIYDWMEEKKFIPEQFFIKDKFYGRTQIIKEKRFP